MSSTADFIPPMINGVSASKVYLQPSSASTVYAYLCQQFPHISAAEWQSRFQDGLVYDAHGQRLHIDSPFQAHTHCFYYRFLAHEVTVPFQHQILFENEDLLVVDKPHFLTMSPTGQYVQQTLLVRLKQQTGNEQLTPIHRLDRETAGVVLFSKQPASRGLYQQMFAERQVRKTYHAIAPFRADLSFPCTTRYRMEKGQPFYTMQVVDGVPNSETDIELLAHNGHLAKYLLKPVTGKQHQLRVHLNQLGIAILNDPFYPQVQHKTEDDFSAPLQLLAKDICFQDPISKAAMAFSSQFDLTL
ncbi:RluA family pseudouridine synthase [Acinetobacter indicus]|uniref:RluA family pseudouridine synthase n=1 Tax=Acinetobacter indicus TaxID=756892 RepID=UPI001444972F|nr:RluA family pseudouridine synthase [Acinetobacter indicus]MDM1271511.1 RluA family pseudouridine synthase [Acinetobacter indicus]MDM1285800.1 RluA family pseudouridine synthase [Acinetobacter indicus]